MMGRSRRRSYRKDSRKMEILEWARSLLIAVLVTLILRLLVFEFIRVDGHSMLETLHHNEYMFVTKPQYWFSLPQRFDVVVCHYPGESDIFVKRVVGLEGDEIRIEDGNLYINGQLQDESYITHPPIYDYYLEKVPEGGIFVMGDNRGNSKDSRDPNVSVLSKNDIIGKVRAVAFPFNAWRGIQ